MSSRRSARASAASRQSYREDSDDDDVAPDDLTEDEYEQHDGAVSAEDDDPELEPEPSDSDEPQDEPSRRSAKRRKTASSTSASKAASSKAAQNSDWAPGVTRVVAKLVGAPTTAHVAKGELSPNVLRFLSDLAANNDRDWFARHDAVYRYCWTNFGDFASAVLDDIMQVDPTVPWLPTKDLVYRIYRDVRFSNDKTPYKTNLMASYSRGGRKGPFAGYHVLIKPGGRSFFAAGRWQPEKEDLAAIRQHILEKTPQAQALRQAVEEPSFVKLFGPPKLNADSKVKGQAKAKAKSKPDQQRCNLWGGDDELKVAPKIAGVDKTHPDIHWLKLRSFCAIHNFTDEEVLSKQFRKRLVEAAKVSEPLVTILNSITSPDPPSPPPSDGEQDSQDEEDADEESADEESAEESAEEDV